MARSPFTLVCVLITLILECYCIPIKPQSPNQGATDECYGTYCYYGTVYSTDTTVNVNFPENLTEADMLSLPKFLSSQSETISLLNKTLISQGKVADLLEHRLDSMEALIDTRLHSLEQQVKNMTSVMAVLLGNVADLLQTQTNIARAGLLPFANDCQDIAAKGGSISGPYVITPPDGHGSFEVFCDLESENEGWTVFQRRFDGSVDFFRNWDDYEQGFGDKSGEYWLGLKNIRRLTSDGTTWALKIDMESTNGATAHSSYDSFTISNATTKYTLSVGKYSGNGGDSLKNTGNDGIYNHNGMPFSTYDQDNDRDPNNCAQEFKGGWWYNNCYTANLNGKYINPPSNSSTGMRVHTWNEKLSLKSSQMKIRRVQ